MSLLEDLFAKYGTDKNHHGYTPFYTAELEARRHEVKRVLEIGISCSSVLGSSMHNIGASLWSWHDFFPNAEIVGIDIDPRWMVNSEDGRIRSFCVDAYDTQALLAVMTKIGGEPFDFIVDDADHDPGPQVQLLRDLSPYLAQNGLYAIEDVCPYKLPSDGSVQGNRMRAMVSRFPSFTKTTIHYANKTLTAIGKDEVLVFVEKAHPALGGGLPEFREAAEMPLLGLVMVVKNEAHGIASTLMSLREHIDTWTILDTGSTDGTQDIIREVLSGEFTVPGNLIEEPFVDFSTTYNRALDLHGPDRNPRASQFILHILGDEILTDGAALRAFCKLNPTGNLFYVPMRQGDVDYKLPRLSRPGAGHYVGRTHEYFSGAVSCTAPGKITRGVAPDEAARKRRRWELDREILEADLAKNPTTDVRSAFYLAQTYECLGMKTEAVAMYERRIAMPGAWSEETFEAQRRSAALQGGAGDNWPAAQQAYLDAFALDPKRAEPLYQIAKHWYDKEQHALVCLFAEKALAIPKPDTAMFVDHEIYDWKIADLLAISSFYAGDKIIGARAAEKAVRARPGDERMRNNRAFYAKSAAEMFPAKPSVKTPGGQTGVWSKRSAEGYRSQEIKLLSGFLAPGWFAMNPSITRHKGVLLCIIRTVNYDIAQNYKTCDGGPIRTRNYMVELGPDLQIRLIFEMRESPEVAATPRSAFPIHGFEDCRLFSSSGSLFATATVCDFDMTGQGKREIVLLALDDDYRITSAIPLRGPWSERHQKNWVPLVRDDQVGFVYATDPYAKQMSWTDGVLGVGQQTDFSPGRLRGGTQGVWISGWDGWLFLVHDVTFSGNARTYLHRWVFMHDNGHVAMSDLFFFERRGIEFAAGLTIRGEVYSEMEVVVSFAVGDQKPYFGTFSLPDVLGSLKDGLTP